MARTVNQRTGRGRPGKVQQHRRETAWRLIRNPPTSAEAAAAPTLHSSATAGSAR